MLYPCWRMVSKTVALHLRSQPWLREEEGLFKKLSDFNRLSRADSIEWVLLVCNLGLLIVILRLVC